MIGSLLVMKVVLWHSYRAGEERALTKCVNEFNRTHVELQVEAVAIPSDTYQQKLSTAIPLGNGPDLFIGAHDHLGEQIATDLVARVDDKLPAGAFTAFVPSTVAPLTIGGKVYGLPLAFKSLALFYRLDFIREPPRTTADIEALGARLTKSGKYALAYEAGSYFQHAPWLHGHGGALEDASGVPRLDTPAGLAAIKMVDAWRRARVIPEEANSVVATQLFNQGLAAMTINGPWFLGEIAEGVPYAVAPLPTLSATGAASKPLVTIEAIFLSSRARSAESALTFARWLTDVYAASVRATIGRQPVATMAAWDHPTVASDPVLRMFRAQLAATVPVPTDKRLQLLWEPGQMALRAVLRGSVSPETALARAETRLQRTLAPPPNARSPLLYVLALGGVTLFLLMRALRRPPGAAPLSRFTPVYATLAPAVLSMLVLVFIPFVVGGALSLFDYHDGHYTFIGAQNFAELLNPRTPAIDDPFSFYFGLWVTVLWTVCNVVLHVAVGLFLALLLWRVGVRLRPVYRVLLIVPWAMPNYITGLIWKSLFHRQFGAINALLGLFHVEPVAWFSRFSTAFFANVATNVWLGFPFMMVTALGALSEVPRELDEAAELDGASLWQRLRHITLPLVLPRMWPAVLLGTIWTFNMFNVVFLVSGGEPDGATDILVSQAYRWAFTRGHRYGYAAAYAVVIFLMLWIFSRIIERKEETT